MNDKKQPDQDEIVASVSTTSCRQCVFAEYEGNKQVGCHAGRFEVFNKHGVDLIYVKDNEKEFYLVKDKACAYFRHIDRCQEALKNHTIEELKEKIGSGLKIPYQAMIFFRDGDDLDDLGKRLDELEAQYVKPSIVSIIDRTHSTEDITPKIVGLFHNNYKFDVWRTQRVKSTDVPDGSTIDVCYDSTKKEKYFFYIVFEASLPIPDSFSKEIHHSIQQEMKNFVYLEANKEGIGKTVLKAAHAKYGGNAFDIDLKDKLIHYDDGVDLIRKVEDLCPSLQAY